MSSLNINGLPTSFNSCSPQILEANQERADLYQSLQALGTSLDEADQKGFTPATIAKQCKKIRIL